MVICHYAGYKNLGSCGVSLKIFKAFSKWPHPPPPTPSQVINDQPFSIVFFNPATLTGIKSHSRIHFGCKLELFLVVLSLFPQLNLFVANWFASSLMELLLAILTTICFLLFFLWARNANCWNTSIIVSTKSA